jgi:hypothetical protein
MKDCPLTGVDVSHVRAPAMKLLHALELARAQHNRDEVNRHVVSENVKGNSKRLVEII